MLVQGCGEYLVCVVKVKHYCHDEGIDDGTGNNELNWLEGGEIDVNTVTTAVSLPD